MASFDHFGNMYDVALKPRLLHSLIREHIPDEKRSFSNPIQLSKVASLIRTHSLLSESFPESTRPKLVEAWKSALASWLDRIYSLLSNTMPDKRWAGISLLGVTCEQCSSERFLESYSIWFQKLLSFLQSPVDSHLVKVAACSSMSDLFVRLSGYPKIKKDSSSCAVKVVQPTLKMLNDDSSEATWDAGVHLLCIIITSFPFSIRNHYDNVESTIVSKLLSGGCSLDMLKKLAHCLALLPKSKGDEESWSVMIQKILVLINDQLNLAFHGLEEETMRNVVTRLLVLPGKHPPPPLGGYILTEEVVKKASNMSEQSLMSNVSTLMFCCCVMLTNSYPAKVNVPLRLLLALVERIMMVNGSLPQMSLPFMTSKQQENICSELPVLHLRSVELLMAMIKSMGSRLLPHAAYIVRVVTKYFKTCDMPELRIKVYSIARNLFITMGVGMALYLAQEVVNNAFADLSSIEQKNGGILNGSNSNASAGAQLPPHHKKRRHGSTTGFLQEHDGGGLSVEVPKSRPLTPISLRIAAIETLEALVTVAGALKSEPWRSKVDSLLIVVAMDSFKEGSVSEETNVFRQKEPAAMATDLQLAALRALLVSFLSFAPVRPPFLSQGLELFRRGKQHTGTKLAEFCAHALLTLEVLIHPRALPIADYTYANNNYIGEGQSNLQHDYFGRSNRSPNLPPDYDEYLCAEWLRDGNEADMSLDKNMKYTEEPSETGRANDPEVLSVHVSSGINIQERTEMVLETATCADVEMKTVEDENNFMSGQQGESAVQFQEPVSRTANIPVAETRIDVVDDMVSEKIVSDSTVPRNEASGMETGQGSSVNKFASLSNSSWQRTSGFSILEEFASKFDCDKSDEDDFPDIVDGDPDSD